MTSSEKKRPGRSARERGDADLRGETPAKSRELELEDALRALQREHENLLSRHSQLDSWAVQAQQLLANEEAAASESENCRARNEELTQKNALLSQQVTLLQSRLSAKDDELKAKKEELKNLHKWEAEWQKCLSLLINHVELTADAPGSSSGAKFQAETSAEAEEDAPVHAFGRLRMTEDTVHERLKMKRRKVFRLQL